MSRLIKRVIASVIILYGVIVGLWFMWHINTFIFYGAQAPSEVRLIAAMVASVAMIFIGSFPWFWIDTPRH